MTGLIPFNRGRRELTPQTSTDSFYNMLDDFFSNDWPFRRTLSYDTFKVDVVDEDKSYVVEAELPGVEKKDINVQLNEGRLQISVAREEAKEETDKRYIHRERRYTSMSRSVYLEDARAEDVSAKLEDGVLRVVVPKEEKAVHSIVVDVE
ncbi:MAG: Hsp20/alpha crystallin family protein [Bacillota bacterium]|nr:Hsp20/alpha crystallin family protein [Eubacteriales bacterium]MDI9492467.1 Hsp20/alpha crystallin family protein [Bacillota bacterium]NLV69880.1 Hsp20/alpha crystallin family protein [Clostridiales bacterium]HRV33513.1 Hsp20/alpha crystallin family protein [Anaerovoracaceae bacterium]MDD3537224.1 Hsp20/alpha crystallin family protein [Eubacteriales bacterium]